MIKLKLPRLADIPPERLPAELRPVPVVPELPATPVVAFGRRAFLRGLAALLGVLALPMTGGQRAWAAARGRFLTGRERETLEALCDRVIPPDDAPGAKALGAARYIDRLLAQRFDRGTPFIFAGGPFSGRAPHPDNDTGAPARRRPRNDFRKPVPLTRLQRLYWEAELYGSKRLPEVAALDAQYGGELIGLRDVYRTGLGQVDERSRSTFGAPYSRLTTAQQDELFDTMDRDARNFPPDTRRGGNFFDRVIQHTFEGCFSAPEYGGNRRGAGWDLVGLDGDSQPLGYSIFSRATNGYVERPDRPMSGPDPDEASAPRPISADAQRVQDRIVTLSGVIQDCPS